MAARLVRMPSLTNHGDRGLICLLTSHLTECLPHLPLLALTLIPAVATLTVALLTHRGPTHHIYIFAPGFRRRHGEEVRRRRQERQRAPFRRSG